MHLQNQDRVEIQNIVVSKTSDYITVKIKNIQNMDVTKTNDHIQIKIKMRDPSQKPPASSKAPNEDLKDMDVLFTFKIKIESLSLEHGCIKDQWQLPNQDQDAKPQS